MLDSRKNKAGLTAYNDGRAAQIPTEKVLSVFGTRIKEERKRRGFTQMKLAELSGVSVDTIKRYEAGTAYGARLDTAYYIAGALGISLDSLLPQWPDSPSFLLQDPEVQSAVLILAERLKKIK